MHYGIEICKESMIKQWVTCLACIAQVNQICIIMVSKIT